jgi:hypothetical protein
MFETAIIIAVVMALTEFVKRMEIIPVKYLPAVSLVLGLLAGLFYVDVTMVQDKIMYGLMIGLSAAGLFDQTKIITKGMGK